MTSKVRYVFGFEMYNYAKNHLLYRIFVIIPYNYVYSHNTNNISQVKVTFLSANQLKYFHSAVLQSRYK